MEQRGEGLAFQGGDQGHILRTQASLPAENIRHWLPSTASSVSLTTRHRLYCIKDGVALLDEIPFGAFRQDTIFSSAYTRMQSTFYHVVKSDF